MSYFRVLIIGLAFQFCVCDLSVAADIRSTLHNLSRKRASVEVDEVCVFCHTPQVAKNQGAANVPRPIWQPSLPENHHFEMFDDIGRKQYGKQAIGTQSIACMSCHDSVQAFGAMAGESDHPFGVPYRGYLKSQGRNEIGDQENKNSQDDKEALDSRSAHFLKALDDFRPPSKGRMENRTVWWVSSGGSGGVRTRSDLPLYARKVEDVGEIPYIECSSCHDPHVDRSRFLRVTNDGSKLCLTCHDK